MIDSYTSHHPHNAYVATNTARTRVAIRNSRPLDPGMEDGIFGHIIFVLKHTFINIQSPSASRSNGAIYL